MKLAIIIPIYNAAKTVGETIASLQRIEHGWEYVGQVLLCDDASKDNGLPVIQRSHFDRCPLRVLRHEVNKGEAAAYATMVASLSDDTEWFLILHSDDLALPNFLTRNLEIIKQCDEKVASVSSNYWVFDQNTETLAAAERDVVLFRAGTEENIRHTALVGCWWHISGALVNKKLWVEFGGRDARIPCSGDWDLLLRWQLNGYTVGHSVIATTKYRKWLSTSLSSSDYPICRDFRERTRVALGLPGIFHGRTKRIFAFLILKGALRRSAKFMLHGKIFLATNAFETAIGCFFTLLGSRRVSRVKEAAIKD
jgi:glycosyltransferase involved in cell wall biosynthesis